MADAPLVFQQAFISLKRVLGSKWSPALAERFKALNVDLEAPEPAYPLDTWVKCLNLGMETLYPGVPLEKATHDIGRRMVEAISETVFGGALFKLLQILGPKRGLQRMARNLRSSNNYSESQVTEVGAGEYELALNLVNYPHYYVGMLEAGLGLMGAKAPVVTLHSHSPDKNARFRIRFE